jgi:basic membrane lipoprotein Med (substrate-binding protein (PBP1-ABC) superfamily)
MSAFDFVMKHITHDFSSTAYQSRNVVKLNDFAKQITDLINGRGFMVKDAYEQFFQETLNKVDPITGKPLIDGSMTDADVIQVLKDEYAKKNAPSYFQR